MLVLDGFVGPAESGSFDMKDKPGEVMYWASVAVQDRSETFETDHVRVSGDRTTVESFLETFRQLLGQQASMVVKATVRKDGKESGLRFVRLLTVPSSK